MELAVEYFRKVGGGLNPVSYFFFPFVKLGLCFGKKYTKHGEEYY